MDKDKSKGRMPMKLDLLFLQSTVPGGSTQIAWVVYGHTHRYTCTSKQVRSRG